MPYCHREADVYKLDIFSQSYWVFGQATAKVISHMTPKIVPFCLLHTSIFFFNHNQILKTYFQSHEIHPRN